jgi:hypothetical protein
MTSARVQWKWTPECQDSFEKMKAIMAKKTLVTFPNFTKEFKIHTDASKLQLGACILQGGNTVSKTFDSFLVKKVIFLVN